MRSMGNTEQQWVEKLVAAVPVAREWIDADDLELPYVAFGDFAVRLCEGIQRHAVDPSTIDQALEVFARMAASDNPATLNLLGAGALEVITDSREAVLGLRPLMSGRLRNCLDYTILTWRGGEPIDWRAIDLDEAPDEGAVLAAIDGSACPQRGG